MQELGILTSVNECKILSPVLSERLGDLYLRISGGPIRDHAENPFSESNLKRDSFHVPMKGSLFSCCFYFSIAGISIFGQRWRLVSFTQLLPLKIYFLLCLYQFFIAVFCSHEFSCE